MDSKEHAMDAIIVSYAKAMEETGDDPSSLEHMNLQHPGWLVYIIF